MKTEVAIEADNNGKEKINQIKDGKQNQKGDGKL
jgi:hypothetical protein